MHPDQILFQGERALPQLPAIDHYAGSEKLIVKALSLQHSLGPVFDITCDCEDGAMAGQETEHARMAAAMVMSEANRFGRVGARIHDITHAHWQRDVEILVHEAGSRLAFLTLPKPRSVEDVAIQVAYVNEQQRLHGQHRRLPIHVLIETHGALRDAWDIAALDDVESLDFGLMDFVSAHHGAIPASAMRSPGQFEHPLIVRAKCEIAAAALANGVVPSHNVTTELTDTDYIEHDARRARQEFGYLRMWSIHPRQIEPILNAMRPDFSEIEQACAILNAAADAQWGPIRHEGKLHDRASYRYYWTLLKRAHATGADVTDAARQRFFSE
ncbi:CoA ester lyase [Nitrogeniibacter mangrovi]|uniref:CoA ester lyase n=1 Tax=Nitrogeniibacter mangrovi TaxID=2016596 RepID=A0A6C1B406_9RHOO|nr:aldolase/citrate lyase family protein [Nitrogeniibacter mangrovi]QID17729.1 CoA ester lyase [Nitrogeniibacter mangrovi]